MNIYVQTVELLRIISRILGEEGAKGTVAEGTMKGCSAAKSSPKQSGKYRVRVGEGVDVALLGKQYVRAMLLSINVGYLILVIHALPL